jgi:hypothetical protein
MKDETEYYVKGTENYIKYLVERLSKYSSLQGRNISMDRLYSSFSIADWLLNERSITMIGTLQHNRVGIPPELKEVRNKEPLQSELYWEKSKGDVNLTSYTVKTSKGKKNVLVMATVRPILGVTKDDGKKKPAIIKLYDFTKGGTDIVDQKIGFYSVKPKSRRWTIAAFSYILDTIRVNAGTIMALNTNTDAKKINSFEFGTELAESLVMPHIRTRNKNGLQSTTILKMKIMTGDPVEKPPIPEEPQFPTTGPSKKRCRMCINSTVGAEHKQTKDTLAKTKSLCQFCGESSCRKHLIHLCLQCKENLH